MRFDGAFYDKKTQTVEISDEWIDDVLPTVRKFGTVSFDDKTQDNAQSTVQVTIPQKYKFKIKPY